MTDDKDARIAALEMELEAAKRDAARYRWLRGTQDQIVLGADPGTIDYGMTAIVGTYGTWLSDVALDAAIDAAMKD